MNLLEFTECARPEIDREMRSILDKNIPGNLGELRSMIAYHLGWEGDNAGPSVQGKRIRPLLVLLSNHAAKGNWREALPAAAAVEFVHNFSLIHDDIEDQSHYRHHRETLWSKWGIAQAINTGDSMYTMSFDAILKLSSSYSPSMVIDAYQILIDSCTLLTQGQYLDIARQSVSESAIGAYWPMIKGKTASLIRACTELGALTARANVERIKAFRTFGENLGMAFQVIDDYLGIWGSSEQTGKPSESDLVLGKKTLPILFGLQKKGAFAKRWVNGNIQAKEVQELSKMLVDEGAAEFTQHEADRLTNEALAALKEGAFDAFERQPLEELALKLLHRSY